MSPQADKRLCVLEGSECPNGQPPATSTTGGQPDKAGAGLSSATETGSSESTTIGGDQHGTNNGDGSLDASSKGTAQPTNPSPAASLAVPTSSVLNVSSTTTSGSKGNSGVSSGAVAGIAIATAIIGAALAFLAAFFLFKKRNRNQGANNRSAKYETYADSTPELVMAPKNIDTGRRDSSYVQVSQTAVPLAHIPDRPVQQAYSLDPLASILPPAADEHEIQSKVAGLFGEMHRHVDAYYRDVHASITSSLEPELAQFGTKDVNMVELLQSCSNPTVGLKHALVAYTLGITGPKDGEDMETMFPKELGSVPVDGAVSGANYDVAATLHRRLSVYLYDTSCSHQSRSRNSWALSSGIREAAEHFSLTFFPWANPTDNDQERDERLIHIISSALSLRIWLFGQPNVYDFSWERAGSRGVVVSPALVRRTDGRVILEMGVISV